MAGYGHSTHSGMRPSSFSSQVTDHPNVLSTPSHGQTPCADDETHTHEATLAVKALDPGPAFENCREWTITLDIRANPTSSGGGSRIRPPSPSLSGANFPMTCAIPNFPVIYQHRPAVILKGLTTLLTDSESSERYSLSQAMAQLVIETESYEHKGLDLLAWALLRTAAGYETHSEQALGGQNFGRAMATLLHNGLDMSPVVCQNPLTSLKTRIIILLA